MREDNKTPTLKWLDNAEVNEIFGKLSNDERESLANRRKTSLLKARDRARQRRALEKLAAEWINVQRRVKGLR